MYINIGEEFVLQTQDITGIFDMDKTTVNKATRDFLAKAQKENRVVLTSYDLPKSFIIAKDKIYISPLNTSTLLKRAGWEK
ncbi:MAG TPA: DUF370 domain-containing protein [Candidatus Eubacterium faecipullorum]|uniref:DUF370 domain-containing protein n=1 Tax=Candidatus Eubacterium faecipullorum TaxID=2838571 RepID=A0A9D1UF57_9FIRM|nr:DUF370 domain-containing protein [Candidatus Eubacterium faecipullorum]